MRRTILLILSQFFFLICASASIIPENLRCEHCVDPRCVDEVSPRLSWINRPGRNDCGEIQTAYRLVVSSSRQNLDKGIFDLWDSGIVESDESNLIPYSGSPLVSAQDCWWKVMVWNRDGKASAWSKPAYWGMGLLDQSDWKAQWIGSDWRHGASPLFRKSLNINKKIKSAKAFTSARGFFEFSINGKKVGDDLLCPGFTNADVRPGLKDGFIAIDDNFRDYRILYLCYDVTPMLKAGENELSALIGDGYYDPVLTYRQDLDEPFGKTAFICQILIKYEDGSTETVVTDGSWTVERSKIVSQGIYTGETYDDRVATDGRSARPASLIPPIRGKFSAQTSPADRVIERVKPVSICPTGDGGYVVDFGKMITGWVHFKGIDGNRGDTLKVVCAIESPVGTQNYIFSGKGNEEYAPRFTWLTFTRVEVRGVKNLKPSQLWADFVGSDIPVTSRFECSTHLLERIHDAWILTMRDNAHCGVVTDCPHRERTAYLGDAQASSLCAMHNFECRSFYGKWLRDWRDCQNVETGYVPNAAPWQPSGGGGIPWGAAMNIVPWEYYVQFGDLRQLEQSYEPMKEQLRWMRTFENGDGLMLADVKTLHSPRGDEWVNLAEWLPAFNGYPGDCHPDKNLVYTFYMWLSADNIRKAARVLGKIYDESLYASVADHIKEGFHKIFYNPDTKSYGPNGENTFALAMGVPEDRLAEVRQTLRHEIKYDWGGHQNTGIYGSRYLFDELCKAGAADIAYTAMNKKDRPSIGYWIEDGATTFREEFGNNNSHCHPMYGSAVTWMYRRLAGVMADESRPGYRHFTVRPYPVEGMRRVFYSNESPYGTVASEVVNRDGEITLTVTVPVSCTATVYVPGSASPAVVGQGTHVFKASTK